MGYRIKPKGYKLVFADSDKAGFEVTARSINTGQFLEFQAARATKDAGGEGAQGATRQMLQMFADAIITWNAEDEDGQPIPATLEGLCTLDLDFNMDVINAWMDAINGVSSPLPGTSTDGSTSVEASIPMDAQLASLAS